ncbi:hypothetical protein [Streptomyces sp. NPDC054834]
MDIYYLVGPEESSDGPGIFPDRMLRRQEALSLSRAGSMERVALQEVISLVRLGVCGHVRIPHEKHLEDVVTRAVACAEIMALGTPVTIGKKLVTADPEPGSPQGWAFEAAQERHRLLPPSAGAERGDAYISPGWPTDEECARLAHKLVHEMGYSQANVARIFELVDGYERPSMWTRQGINRLLWEECDGEKYPRYHYSEKSGDESRRAGRLHLPGSFFNAIAVLGDEGAEAAAQKFDASLDEPHHLIFPVGPRHPDRSLAWVLRQIMDLGCVRTLYVTSPGAVFSTPAQRRVLYDLALFRGVQVVENGTRIDVVAGNPHYNRLLREGTELFAGLRVRDNATIVEETRSLTHARKTAASRYSQGDSLRKIAAHLQAETVPTPSGIGAWSASAVKKLLDSEWAAER